MIDCLFRRQTVADAEEPVFIATDGTRSNWDAEIQHGSPPLALLTKMIEDLNHRVSGSELRIGRLSLDILGAIPVAAVQVRARVDRPGSRISLITAEMLADRDGGRRRVVARVSAWLLATSGTRDVTTDRYPPLAEGRATEVAHAWEGAPGYLETVSWRRQAEPGGSAAEVWLSPLVPLVDSEPTTPLQRLAMVVDSANGIGAVLDPQHFVFMNTDTVVHLHRLPTGSDFGLRSRGSVGPDGIGVTTAEIFDRRGFIGTCAQTLLIQRRI
ncbi:MAG: thioesterase family protein [Actinomycetia bacterium]|nr:thioesterase family protein [Actinomycetes bacterium]MCH9701762.1 thioesterase family protein [Actinomycetes bacterium]MCH9759221.1 thioesterase family protein [Actinomycetes bacterium]